MRWTARPAFAGLVALLFTALLTGCAATGRDKTDETAPRPPVVEPLPEAKQETPKPNHLALARNLVQEKHYDVALVQLEAARNKQGGTPELFYLTGVCYRETNRDKEAEQAFRKALDLDANHAPAYNGLAMVHQRQGRQEEALAAFRKAVDLDPARADFLNNLGYALLKQGQYEEALVFFRKSLSLDSTYQTARNNLALCVLHLHRDAEALQVLLGGNSPWVAYHNMAVLYRMTGRPDKAVVMERKSGELRKEDERQQRPDQPASHPPASSGTTDKRP